MTQEVRNQVKRHATGPVDNILIIFLIMNLEHLLNVHLLRLPERLFSKLEFSAGIAFFQLHSKTVWENNEYRLQKNIRAGLQLMSFLQPSR
ncbi:MAG: hypothetical protein K9G39_05750 [Chlorobium sp.]|uniref:hypothetical protein n=1 Tax=Chlorobium sp. TaxID=1095 RepID=UPI0025BF5682|nr:hypothetical protein [Chlorobium sp.]MCF8383086.1 hypothetical protein [Chlorobium sp.]